MHRLWSSSYETMLGTISLYFYVNLKPEMDINLVMLCILQSISFVIRNTSPIAWVVLLLVKMWELRWIKGSGAKPDNMQILNMIMQLLKVFFLIFVPIFIIATALDSMFHGKPTCVPWNFIKINVFESLSQEFGADPLLKYVTVDIPALFNIQLPFILVGLYRYTM